MLLARHAPVGLSEDLYGNESLVVPFESISIGQEEDHIRSNLWHVTPHEIEPGSVRGRSFLLNADKAELALEALVSDDCLSILRVSLALSST